MLKSLEAARQEKFIGAPLEARVRIAANGDLYPLLSEYSQELPALFIVSQVSLENNPARDLSVTVERADRRQVRALLEVHYRCRFRCPLSHGLRALRRGGGRDAAWLTAGLRHTWLAAAVFGLDRLTKWIVESRVGFFDTYPVIPGFFDIVHSQNRGVAFGMFNDSTSEWRTTLLVTFSIVAVAALAFTVWRVQAGPPDLVRARAGAGRRGRQRLRPARLGPRDGLPRILRRRVALAYVQRRGHGDLDRCGTRPARGSEAQAAGGENLKCFPTISPSAASPFPPTD